MFTARLYLWQLLNLSIAFGIEVAIWSSRTCLFALDHACLGPVCLLLTLVLLLLHLQD